MILEKKDYGVIAEFETPAAILAAAKAVRAAGYRRWDVFTPFPVHGISGAMGLKNSPVGWFALLLGFGAFFGVLGMVWFTNAFDYPIIVGGKPLFSPIGAFTPAYVMLVLAGAVGALGGMLALNRLPQLYHPLLKNRRFAQASHDKFFLVIETADPKYSATATRKLLETAGSRHIEMVEE